MATTEYIVFTRSRTIFCCTWNEQQVQLHSIFISNKYSYIPFSISNNYIYILFSISNKYSYILFSVSNKYIYTHIFSFNLPGFNVLCTCALLNIFIHVLCYYQMKYVL